MNKGILLKLVGVLVAIVAAYALFWFFKVGQIEKRINGFAVENSGNVSIGEVSVSGFPLMQKVTIKNFKFTIPNPLLNKKQVSVKELELNSKIFSSDFSAILPGLQVSIQDSEKKNLSIEFTRDPEITISVHSGKITNFSYKDSGYKILDEDKKVVYNAASSTVNFESKEPDSEGKMVSKLSFYVKESEGFTVVDVYKNVFEKDIMEGVRTGEITLGNESANLALIAAQNNGLITPANPNPPSSNPQQVAVVNPPVVTTNAPAVAIPATPATPASQPVVNNVPPVAAVANVPATNSALNTKQAQVQNPQPAVVPVVNSSSQQQPVANTNPIPQVSSVPSVSNNNANKPESKHDFKADIEYIMVPVKSDADKEQNLAEIAPVVPEIAGQYNRIIRINSLIASNDQHKVTINGELNVFSDDDRPSGAITLKVDNLDNLIGYVVSAINNEITVKNTQPFAVSNLGNVPNPQPIPAPVVPPTNPSPQNVVNNNAVAPSAPTTGVAPNPIIPPTPAVGNVGSDSYTQFLQRISSGFSRVTKELAAKNTVSKGDVAVFDISREKNLEFLVNNTPPREIFGKF